MRKTKSILIPYFLATLIFLFVSLPIFNRYLEQEAILAVETRELEREGAYIDEIMRVENELAPYESILSEIKGGLPADPALPSLIRHLEILTADSGLHLTNIGSFSTINSPERPHLKETTLEMTVVGNNYASIKNFMQELQRSIRLINIASAKISPIADDEGGLRFSLSLSLKTYSY